MASERVAPAPTIVVLMGVAGSGKTTVGRLLAERLGWPYVEGDDFHPPGNVAKMHRGEGLSDAERAPWLAAIAARIDELRHEGRSAVVTCSALKAAYRAALRAGRPCLRFVWLHAADDVLAARLRARHGHFVGEALLASQLATLEPPRQALRVDAGATPEAIVAAIRRGLGI